MDRFDGRVCGVTGGAQGIGLAIARRFARQGGRCAWMADTSPINTSESPPWISYLRSTLPGPHPEGRDGIRLAHSKNSFE
jgi:hypothetical protein